MDVDKAEVGDGDIDHVQYLLLHTISHVAIDGIRGRASGGIEVINQFTKYNSQKWEWNARGDGKEEAGKDEEDVGLGVVQREEEPSIGEEFAYALLCWNAFLQIPELLNSLARPPLYTETQLFWLKGQTY